MRSAASTTLSWASLFLAIVAIPLNSPGLFYMCTALIATIIAAKIQAKYAVKGLVITREAPKDAEVGSSVTVSLSVTSRRPMQRPLVYLTDSLPPRLANAISVPALPIAPAYKQPITTTYSFIPSRRGRYHWSKVEVLGTDAIGLTNSTTTLETAPSELVVYPAPIEFEAPISFGGGMGIEEGARPVAVRTGTDIRGIRNYVSGDPLRHIHWRSTARSGSVMVKEFDTDSTLRAAMLIQDQSGSESRAAGFSSLEAMCGHAMYLAERLLLTGAVVELPGHEADGIPKVGSAEKRLNTIREALTDVTSNKPSSMAERIADLDSRRFGAIFIFLGKRDDALPFAIRRLNPGTVTVLAYNLADYDKAPAPGDVVTSIEYLNELAMAGARIVQMPKVTLE